MGPITMYISAPPLYLSVNTKLLVAGPVGVGRGGGKGGERSGRVHWLVVEVGHSGAGGEGKEVERS